MKNLMDDRVLFGAAYYPEYTPTPGAAADLDLMVDAGFSVIRVGESVWSTWEPEDGRFDLEWLAETLDGAAERGIAVVLGTPTYAVPMWLARKHPEIAAEGADGRRLPWGSRQEADFTHPAYRFHAERVVRAVVGRWADHPAVVGFQVDNEPGLHLLHNPAVVARFADGLRHEHGTVEALNEAWGLTYWSHRLSTWADLWAPHGNAQPQYAQAWRAFQARLTTELVAWQAEVVRRLARADQWVTTCVAYGRPAVDEWDVNRTLDVAAGNPYYGMQDALAVQEPSTASGPVGEDPAAQGWASTGTWALVHAADRMHASRQAPFLVTETNAGPIGDSTMMAPGWDGQWRQVAWQLVARGARMVEYWHWHSLRTGTETYWGGVLPHDQRPGRVYREVARLGGELAAAGALVVGLAPDADVGLLWSAPSKWGLAFTPPFAPAGPETAHPANEAAYEQLVATWARAAFDAALSTRVLHDRQLVGPTGADDGSRHNPVTGADPAQVSVDLPVLLVPALYVADDRLLDWLARYAEAGGHLVLGIRSAVADLMARVRIDVKPARLAEAARVSYQESSRLPYPVALRPADEGVAPDGAPPLTLPAGARATTWLDALVPGGATVLARYDHPQFGTWPAMTTARHGSGRVTVVGTEPDAATAAAVVDWAVSAPGADAAGGDRRTTPRARRWDGPATVRVSTATATDGTRVHVVHNWSWSPAEAIVPCDLHDVLADQEVGAGEHLSLGPWDVRVLRVVRGEP